MAHYKFFPVKVVALEYFIKMKIGEGLLASLEIKIRISFEVCFSVVNILEPLMN